jgi:hypothetical protein
MNATAHTILQKAQSKRLVLGCGALVYDMVALIKKNAILNEVIDLQCLPAKLHNTPQLIAGEVDKYLSLHAHKYTDIFIAYGDCGTAGALDDVLEKYGAERIAGAHCYEFFAGSSAFEKITDEELGSFFLTDYLVKHFDRLVVEGLGLDRYPELFDAYFKHYNDMVYLAQTEDLELQELAQKHAQSFGMNYKYRYTGVAGLMPLVGGLNIEKNNPASAIAVEVVHV